jgi:hypothetical protein
MLDKETAKNKLKILANFKKNKLYKMKNLHILYIFTSLK